MANYEHGRFAEIYPLKNPIDQGYAVKIPNVDPKEKDANGRMTNQYGETIDFYVEEIEASFEMTGTTAQSRNVRQFMPHNIVQPVIMVTGRAPNNFQYNRLASFVRASQYAAINLGEATLETITGRSNPKVETVTLLVKNGKEPGVFNGKVGSGNTGRHVKGIHVPWEVQGYIKKIQAGGERFNYAPKFQFEFSVAESNFKQGTINMGMWEDVLVQGQELKPWLDWINKKGEFVTVENEKSGGVTKKEKKANNEAERDFTHNHEDPGASSFEPAPEIDPAEGTREWGSNVKEDKVK